MKLVTLGCDIEVLGETLEAGLKASGVKLEDKALWTSADEDNFKSNLTSLRDLVAGRPEGQSDIELYRLVNELCGYIVPTNYGAFNSASLQYRLRRNIFNHLWSAAEELKIGLSKPGVTAFPASIPQPLLRNYRTATGDELTLLDAQTATLSTIEVERCELDELVRASISKAWDLASDLCVDLKSQDTPIYKQRIDEVVLAGNGSQYPLVRELLEEQFAKNPESRFVYQKQRVRFDVRDAKFACAKGAAIAQWYLQQQAKEIDRPDATVVDFQPLSEPRMPFTLLLQGESEPLFVRGTHIDSAQGHISKFRPQQPSFAIKRGLKLQDTTDVTNYCEFKVPLDVLANIPPSSLGQVEFRVNTTFDLTAFINWIDTDGQPQEVQLKRYEPPTSDPEARKRNPFLGLN